MTATAIPAKVRAAFAAGTAASRANRAFGPDHPPPCAFPPGGKASLSSRVRVNAGAKPFGKCLAGFCLAAMLLAAPAVHAADAAPPVAASPAVPATSQATPPGSAAATPHAPTTPARPANAPAGAAASSSDGSSASSSGAPTAAPAMVAQGQSAPAGSAPAGSAPGETAPNPATPNPATPNPAMPAPAAQDPAGAPSEAAKAAVTPTVILVHSELLDGSSWRGVIPLLQRSGVNALAVQLPLNSLWADVAVVQRALAIVRGPVILVGHSWGGVIITEAGVDRKVAALVYVAAMAPDVGQSFIDRLRNAPRGPGLAKLLTDSSGFVRLADDAFATDFGQDLDAAQNRLLAATQAPVFGKVFEERVNNAAWKNLPVWYVVAANDRLLDPGVQQAEAGRIKARTVATPASHAVVLSQPEVVAKAILEAVAAVKAGAAAGHDGAAQQLQPLSPPVQPEPPKK
ncbi:pimeloyl-ACP methyl ester carboxylesterase [Camelimonas lactis]|uniref:Pimeloyl-ACP methyl ester carboxylesterase n=2 Tax=Camelimonas lactis TaxID=659006 RepID=A0A4R2GWL1_9HYPH|nr:pimeloyl-ACP methyl ester carboxylesterase [Camelimonas lactis]